MKCLSKALSNLLGRETESCFRWRKPPWCGVDLIYAAYTLGVHLLPFHSTMHGVEYDAWPGVYTDHDGILCGFLDDGRQHAYAKLNSHARGRGLFDDDGSIYPMYGINFQEMRERVFFAWMNKPN